MRMWLNQPEVWSTTLPGGYSNLSYGPTCLTTARSFPSGDQSAHSTPSSMERGAAPPVSEVTASVPLAIHAPVIRFLSESANCPVDEIAIKSAWVKPNARDSGLGGVVDTISRGAPSEASL